MSYVARFVGRKDDNGSVDLIIGSSFKNQTSIKPNKIYEIREILGELVIVELGNMGIKVNWDNSIVDIIGANDKHLFLTESEVYSLNSLRMVQNKIEEDNKITIKN